MGHNGAASLPPHPQVNTGNNIMSKSSASAAKSMQRSMHSKPSRMPPASGLDI